MRENAWTNIIKVWSLVNFNIVKRLGLGLGIGDQGCGWELGIGNWELGSKFNESALKSLESALKNLPLNFSKMPLKI